MCDLLSCTPFISFFIIEFYAFGILWVSDPWCSELRHVVVELILEFYLFLFNAGFYCKGFSLRNCQFLGDTLSILPLKLSRIQANIILLVLGVGGIIRWYQSKVL